MRIETAAIEAGAMSLPLLLEEITEQLVERNLDERHEWLLELAETRKPLVEPVLSAGERLWILEYVYERVSKRLALESLATLFPSDAEGLHNQPAKTMLSPTLHHESHKTARQDMELIKAFDDRKHDLHAIIVAAFEPFVGRLLTSLPPFQRPPAGKLF